MDNSTESTRLQALRAEQGAELVQSAKRQAAAHEVIAKCMKVYSMAQAARVLSVPGTSQDVKDLFFARFRKFMEDLEDPTPNTGAMAGESSEGGGGDGVGESGRS